MTGGWLTLVAALALCASRCGRERGVNEARHDAAAMEGAQPDDMIACEAKSGGWLCVVAFGSAAWCPDAASEPCLDVRMP